MEVKSDRWHTGFPVGSWRISEHKPRLVLKTYKPCTGNGQKVRKTCINPAHPFYWASRRRFEVCGAVNVANTNIANYLFSIYLIPLEIEN